MRVGDPYTGSPSTPPVLALSRWSATAVLRLFSLFAELLRLRVGPQALPASDRVVAVAVVALGGASLLTVQHLYPPGSGAARVGLDLLITVAFFAGLLSVARRPERFRQTFAAVCGTGALLVLITWPLLDIVVERGREDTLYAVAVLALLGVYVWHVVVIGHILRHALDTRPARGIALALIFVLGSGLIGDLVVPPPELEGAE